MASSSLGTLTLDLIARTGGFVKGMSKAERSSQKWRKQVQRDLKKLRGQFAIFAKAAAGAAIAAAGAFTLMAKEGLQYVDAQAKMARRTGATIDGLRGLQLAASDAGVDTNTLNGAIDRMNARLGEARTGSGQAYEALNRLGLSADALANMDADERIAIIADRVKDLGLDSADTADLLRNLGIRNREMVNLLLAGGDGIREARSEIEELGLALNDVDTKKVEEANDAFGRIFLHLEPIKNQIALNLAEPLLEVSELINQAARDSGGFGDVVVDVMAKAARAIATVLDQIDALRVGLLKIQRIQLQSAAAGANIRSFVTGEETTPEQEALDAHNAEIERLESGDTWVSRLANAADNLGDDIERNAEARERELDGLVDATGAIALMEANARSSSEALNAAAISAENAAKALDDFNPSMNDEVQDILDRAGEGSSIDAGGVLRDAWGNALPTLQRELDAEIQKQIGDFKSAQNLQTGLEAAAQAFTDGATTAAKAAWESIKGQSADDYPVGGVMPTGEQAKTGGSGWSSITPRSADDIETAGSVIGWSNDSSKKELESAANGSSSPVAQIAMLMQQMAPIVTTIGNKVGTIAEIMSTGRTPITLTINGPNGSDSADGEVDDNFVKMLADALSGVAAGSR